MILGRHLLPTSHCVEVEKFRITGMMRMDMSPDDNSSRSLLQVDNHIWYYIHWLEIKADRTLE